MIAEELPIYKAIYDLLGVMLRHQQNVQKMLRYGLYGEACAA